MFLWRPEKYLSKSSLSSKFPAIATFLPNLLQISSDSSLVSWEIGRKTLVIVFFLLQRVSDSLKVFFCTRLPVMMGSELSLNSVPCPWLLLTVWLQRVLCRSSSFAKVLSQTLTLAINPINGFLSNEYVPRVIFQVSFEFSVKLS